MKQVIKIDENGFYVEPVIVFRKNGKYEIPSGCIEILPPDGLYRPQWTGTEWIEGATQEYIDELENKKNEVSELAILKTELEQLKEEKKMTDLALLELVEMLLG